VLTLDIRYDVGNLRDVTPCSLSLASALNMGGGVVRSSEISVNICQSTWSHTIKNRSMIILFCWLANVLTHYPTSIRTWEYKFGAVHCLLYRTQDCSTHRPQQQSVSYLCRFGWVRCTSFVCVCVAFLSARCLKITETELAEIADR
jgi:hypothetical protein